MGDLNSQEKPHKCIDCRESFHEKQELLAHGRVHRREKSHPCAECGERFKHQSELSKHQRSHTGESPHSCGECGKSFQHLCITKSTWGRDTIPVVSVERGSAAPEISASTRGCMLPRGAIPVLNAGKDSITPAN
ncbi:unnamed protein product [Lepidochelys olivacea]